MRSELGWKIVNTLRESGISETRAIRALGLSRGSWIRRLEDTDTFRASEIRQLRKLLPDEVCDKITK